MSKYLISILVLLLVSILLVGCSGKKLEEVEKKTNHQTIKLQIIDTLKKYNLKDFEIYEDSYQYILSENKLLNKPTSYTWALQKFNVKKFIGQKIYEYYVDIRNHSLEKNFHRRIFYTFLVCENKIIGGVYFPSGNTSIENYYNLDGEKFHGSYENYIEKLKKQLRKGENY